MADGWLWCNWCSLLNQRTIFDWYVGHMRRYDFARLLCTGHGRPHHHVQRYIQLLEAITGKTSLLASHFGQIAFAIAGAFQIVLTMTDEYQMAYGFRFSRLQLYIVVVLLRC